MFICESCIYVVIVNQNATINKKATSVCDPSLWANHSEKKKNKKNLLNK